MKGDKQREMNSYFESTKRGLMVRVFNCSEMLGSRGNGHGENGWGIVDAIRPCIEGKSTDRVQRACVSSEMQKGTDGLGGSQYLEKRSEFNQRGRCLNDMAQAGVMTQAKFILQKQPVGARRHSFADTMSLVPVGSGGERPAQIATRLDQTTVQW